jgi:ketosteroid isomerase-like protein
MQEHPNVTFARRMSEAFERGDMAALDAAVADDVVWHEIGRAEPRRGKAELRAAMADVDYAITAKVHDIVGNGDHVVVLANAIGTRGGRTLDYRVAEVYHIRDGKVVERWALSDDTARIAEFFA